MKASLGRGLIVCPKAPVREAICVQLWLGARLCVPVRLRDRAGVAKQRFGVDDELCVCVRHGVWATRATCQGRIPLVMVLTRSGMIRRGPKRGSKACCIAATGEAVREIMRNVEALRRKRYLVDSASSHMLVSKLKPCKCKFKLSYSETANGSLNHT